VLHDVPLNIPIVDTETGVVTRPWTDWFIVVSRDKADRVEDGTEDNLLSVDGSGNPQDSGVTTAGLVSGISELEDADIANSAKAFYFASL
jgi:hypothetical protein